MEKHTDDLRNVREGDTVTIDTTEGHHFEAECISRQVQQADPRSGEVRETTIWQFNSDEWKPAATITDGLRSSPDDPEFPTYSALWCVNQEENLGYIEELSIYGKMES